MGPMMARMLCWMRLRSSCPRGLPKLWLDRLPRVRLKATVLGETAGDGTGRGACSGAGPGAGAAPVTLLLDGEGAGAACDALLPLEAGAGAVSGSAEGAGPWPEGTASPVRPDVELRVTLTPVVCRPAGRDTGATTSAGHILPPPDTDRLLFSRHRCQPWRSSCRHPAASGYQPGASNGTVPAGILLAYKVAATYERGQALQQAPMPVR